MATDKHVTVHPLSPHVLQLRIPTPTLPPSFEANSYIIHQGADALWVDAGTTDTRLLDEALAVLAQIGHPRLIALAATHYHRDHTHGLPYMQAKTHAPIYIHEADVKALRSEFSAITADHVDLSPLGPELRVENVRILVDHAPGHTRGHVHFVVPEDGVILVGDHLAGDGSVWIGPPDGDMDLYYDALSKIAAGESTIAGPGHGPALQDARTAAKLLKERRLNREQEILELIKIKARTVDDILEELYRGNIDPSAEWVAKRTIMAHLERLMRLQLVQSDGRTGGPWYQPATQ